MRRFLLLCVLGMLGWLSVGCSSPALQPSTATAVPTAVRGGIFSTATPASGTSPTSGVTATKANNLAELVLRWDSGVSIADIDDVSEIAIRLRERTGIIDAFGDEIQITITYDPQQITPDKIQSILRDLGYPTKKP